MIEMKISKLGEIHLNRFTNMLAIVLIALKESRIYPKCISSLEFSVSFFKRYTQLFLWFLWHRETWDYISDTESEKL